MEGILMNSLRLGAPLLFEKIEKTYKSPGNQINQNQNLPSRNEACPCGSGKRYKHCHGRL